MWLILSLVSAATESFKTALIKKGTINLSPLEVAWGWVTASLIFVLPLLAFVDTPQLNPTFWRAYVIAFSADFTASMLYVRALNASPITLTVPMLAFTPLFIVLTSFLVSGKIPDLLGIGGITLILAGAYLLNLKSIKNLLEPIRAIKEEKGTLMMLAASVLWAIASSFHKLALAHSNPWFYAPMSLLALSLLFTIAILITSPGSFKKFIKKEFIKISIPTGFLQGLQTLSQWSAFTLIFASFVIAVKRTSILFTSLLAWYLFKEDLKGKLIPILLMVLGAMLLSIA